MDSPSFFAFCPFRGFVRPQETPSGGVLPGRDDDILEICVSLSITHP